MGKVQANPECSLVHHAHFTTPRDANLRSARIKRGRSLYRLRPFQLAAKERHRGGIIITESRGAELAKSMHLMQAAGGLL